MTISPILRTERDQLYALADAYWRELRPTGDYFVNDPDARSRYFDAEFWDEREGRNLWWARFDDTIIGFAHTELADDPVWTRIGYIADFYVLPAFRRQGHGQAVAALLYDWFAGKGIQYVRLYVRADNPRALAFWEQEGFETARFQMRKMLGAAMAPAAPPPSPPAVHAVDQPKPTTRSSRFDRYIGIDYSGAETPTSGLSGLRVYVADRASAPVEVSPPPGTRKRWTRRGIAEWLADRLLEDRLTLVGIDHAFSFPHRYFQEHNLPRDWPAFLDDFRQHWPTDDDHMYVDFVRKGLYGNAADRSGDARWRRLTELRARAKSVFQFDVQGSVAKSTHAGLPWLRYVRHRTAGNVHFWPFDGWGIPAGRSAVLETYPALWAHEFAPASRDPHQHDTFAIAAWMQRADRDGSLTGFLNPSLAPTDREIAQVEGWILGVA